MVGLHSGDSAEDRENRSTHLLWQQLKRAALLNSVFLLPLPLLHLYFYAEMLKFIIASAMVAIASFLSASVICALKFDFVVGRFGTTYKSDGFFAYTIAAASHTVALTCAYGLYALVATELLPSIGRALKNA